ncbi:MAG: SRPBCC domain-containing protein [Deltaproteobacteria bacterium]|nr:SRPBCC domain-containing protein [Deltaproteobacteria bacterium]
MYLDEAQHAAFTGALVTIALQAGAAFRAFDGMLSGTILHVVPRRLIVQSWRAAHWPDAAIDSTLILTFVAEDRGGRIELVHVNVADHDFARVSEGWHKYYWASWRAYLTANR